LKQKNSYFIFLKNTTFITLLTPSRKNISEKVFGDIIKERRLKIWLKKKKKKRERGFERKV
jgi:hypothetical protein